MDAHLNRLTIYTKKMDALATFYAHYFGYTAHHDPADRILELVPPGHGVVLQLHPMSKGQKEGQVSVKLTFDVANVPEFSEWAREKGLVFGAIHQADGYQFANAKDPAKNSISISSRAFRQALS